MTIRNEALRLFFAVSALILVGMLSAPTGGTLTGSPSEIRPEKMALSEVSKMDLKSKAISLKLTDKKIARKLIAKKG